MQAVDGRFFQLSPELAGQTAGNPSPEVEAQISAASRVVTLKNSGVMIGLVGGMLAVGLAFAEASAHPMSRGRAGAVAAALLVGLSCGAAGGAVNLWLSELDALQAWDRTYRAMLLNSANLGMLGFAAGLSVGLPTFSVSTITRTLAGGLTGGILAGALFPFAAALIAIFAYLGDAEDSIPTGTWLRLVWLVLGALLISSMIYWTCGRTVPSTTGPTPN
jgi:hypothetical protein